MKDQFNVLLTPEAIRWVSETSKAIGVSKSKLVEMAIWLLREQRPSIHFPVVEGSLVKSDPLDK